MTFYPSMSYITFSFDVSLFFSIATDYVSVFDGYDYGVDEEMSTEVSCDPMQQGLPSIESPRQTSSIPGLPHSHTPPTTQGVISTLSSASQVPKPPTIVLHRTSSREPDYEILNSGETMNE